MRLLANKPSYVFGERILVELTIPPPKPGDATGARLSWSAGALTKADAASADETKDGMGADVSHTLKGGKFVVPVYAPWWAPGRYSLRLFQGQKLIDSVVVPVSKGWVSDGIIADKNVYATGETIEFTVTLPENRFYYGHWSGPSVLLFPLELAGRSVPKEEAIKKVGGCTYSCSGWLASIAKSSTPNPFTGIGIQPREVPDQQGDTSR